MPAPIVHPFLRGDSHEVVVRRSAGLGDHASDARNRLTVSPARQATKAMTSPLAMPEGQDSSERAALETRSIRELGGRDPVI